MTTTTAYPTPAEAEHAHNIDVTLRALAEALAQALEHVQKAAGELLELHRLGDAEVEGVTGRDLEHDLARAGLHLRGAARIVDAIR